MLGRILRGLSLLEDMICLSDEKQLELFELLKNELPILLDKGYLIPLLDFIDYTKFNYNAFEQTLKTIESLLTNNAIGKSEIYWNKIYILIDSKDLVFCQVLKQYMDNILSQYFSHCVFTVNIDSVIKIRKIDSDNDTIRLDIDKFYQIYRNSKESKLVNYLIENYYELNQIKWSVDYLTKIKEHLAPLTVKTFPYFLVFRGDPFGKPKILQPEDLIIDSSIPYYKLTNVFFDTMAFETYFKRNYNLEFHRFTDLPEYKHIKIQKLTYSVNSGYLVIDGDKIPAIKNTMLFEKNSDMLHLIYEFLYFTDDLKNMKLHITTPNGDKSFTYGYFGVAPLFRIPLSDII